MDKFRSGIGELRTRNQLYRQDGRFLRIAFTAMSITGMFWTNSKVLSNKSVTIETKPQATTQKVPATKGPTMSGGKGTSNGADNIATTPKLNNQLLNEVASSAFTKKEKFNK